MRSEGDGALSARLGDGSVLTLPAFLDGESLPWRHDPEFADLSWDPVSAMSHLLGEYEAS